MRALKLLALFAALAAWSAAQAQGYPNRAVKMIVPYAPGGLPDTMARLVGTKLADALGQQMVIENKGGAGGISGVTDVVKAPADGYTLLIADVGQIAINPHLFSKLPYDPIKDLTPISLVGTSPLYLVAHPSANLNAMGDLVARAKAEPGKLNYGSSGIGSIHHLASEALWSGLGVQALLQAPADGYTLLM